MDDVQDVIDDGGEDDGVDGGEGNDEMRLVVVKVVMNK